MSRPNERAVDTFLTYLTGYVLALVLTGLAFATVYWNLFSYGWILGIVFGLGIVQMVVHLRYFLHVDLQRSARDDLQLILFSTVIICLAAGGTLVILLNLHHRMM